MFTSPLFWLKIVLLLAIVASVTYAVHRYNEGLRDEGRQEVQAKWDAATKLANEIEEKAAAQREADLEKANVDRDKRFAELAGRNAALQAQLASERVGSATLRSLLDSVRTSNAEGTAGGTPQDSTPVTESTGDKLADWFAEVAKLYASCRRQVICWNDFWDQKEGGQCGVH